MFETVVNRVHDLNQLFSYAKVKVKNSFEQKETSG